MKKEVIQDKVLYQQFLDGDMNAFENLIMKYKNSLLYFIFRYVKNIDVAEDIFQDSIMYILSKKEVYNSDYSFKTFLYTIAKSRALNCLRQNNVRNEPLEEAEGIKINDKLIEDLIIEKEIDSRIKKLFLKLKEDYQVVIFLAIIEDLSYSEIAKIMNKDISQIKNLVHRARVKLRMLLIQEKIVEVKNNKIIRLISIILIVCALTSGITYAGITIYQTFFVRKIEVKEPSEEEIKYSMRNGDRFVKIGKYAFICNTFANEIYKYDLEKNMFEKLCKIEGVKKIYFDGEYVYALTDYYAVEKGIYKIDLLGNIEKIYDKLSLQLLITENEIYFTEQIGYEYTYGYSQGNIYKMDKNGNNLEKIVDNIKHDFFIENDYIYYIDKDSRSLYRADLDGDNKVELVKGRITINAVTDKFISYTDSSAYVGGDSNFIGILFLDTNENYKIDSPNGFYANNNEMYFYAWKYDIENNIATYTLYYVDVEKHEVIEKWHQENPQGIPFLTYVYNGNAYFYGSNCYRIDINNVEQREDLCFDTLAYLDGKAYQFKFTDSFEKSELNIFDLDDVSAGPVTIKLPLEN